MNKKLKNPFLLTGYYGKKYFCDREDELEILKEHFENERNVVLFSWRRFGKTALIQHFMNVLEDENETETLYIDFLGTRNIDNAITQITRAVYEKYGLSSGGVSSAIQTLLGKVGAEISFDAMSGFPKINIGIREAKMAEKSLQAIGEFLQNRKKRVLIAIDEFQQIQHYTDENGEAIFRSWMQSYPGIRFIFSGSHRNLMRAMFTEKKRPFYRSAQLIHLQAIEFNKYKSFIQSHFKAHHKTITNEAIESIYLWSRKQTYCVQLICNKLFGLYDNVGIENLPLVYSEILAQESSFFSSYTNLLTTVQWKVMKAIAKEEPLEKPTSKEFIHKHHLGAASSVNTALKTLEKSEIIIKDDDAYYVHDVLLARWLQTL